MFGFCIQSATVSVHDLCAVLFFGMNNARHSGTEWTVLVRVSRQRRVHTTRAVAGTKHGKRARRHNQMFTNVRTREITERFSAIRYVYFTKSSRYLLLIRHVAAETIVLFFCRAQQRKHANKLYDRLILEAKRAPRIN